MSQGGELVNARRSRTLRRPASSSNSAKSWLAKIQSKVEKSPTGRVNVAWAGVITRVSAVFRMLLDAAANGKATTNTAAPRRVATKQPGRTKATSVMAAMAL